MLNDDTIAQGIASQINIQLENLRLPFIPSCQSGGGKGDRVVDADITSQKFPQGKQNIKERRLSRPIGSDKNR